MDDPKVTNPNPWLTKFIGESYGTYELLELIGVGGMGAVYKATSSTTGRTAAVKLLIGEGMPERTARFILEAKGQIKLKDADVPNIGEIYEAYEQTDDKPAAIVMEYIAGESLDMFLIRNVMEFGKIEFQIRMVTLLRDITHTMALAHQHGVKHRDLKPENIMILNPEEETGDLKFKIIDFGLCRIGEDAKLTETTSGMGTPLWVPPEQVFKPQEADRQADIFPLGMLLFQIFSFEGEHFYEGVAPGDQTAFAQMHQFLQFIQNPKKVDERLKPLLPLANAIIRKCIAADWRDRYAGMYELKGALEALLNYLRLMKRGIVAKYYAPTTPKVLDPIVQKRVTMLKGAKTDVDPKEWSAAEEAVYRKRRRKKNFISGFAIVAFLGTIAFLVIWHQAKEQLSLPPSVNSQDTVVSISDASFISTFIPTSEPDASVIDASVSLDASVLPPIQDASVQVDASSPRPPPDPLKKLFTERDDWCRANDKRAKTYHKMWTFHLHCHYKHMRQIGLTQEKFELAFNYAQMLYSKFCRNYQRRKFAEKSLNKQCNRMLRAYTNIFNNAYLANKKMAIKYSLWKPYQHYISRRRLKRRRRR